MTTENIEAQQQEEEFDPVFLHSRREAIVIFCFWLVALLWAVPFCYLNGYAENIDPENFSTTWGIPTWLFWGILVPWFAADLVTAWFCFFFMKDDELGMANEGDDIEEEIAERRSADAARHKEEAP